MMKIKAMASKLKPSLIWITGAALLLTWAEGLVPLSRRAGELAA
jgi:hypothetical protein